MTQTFSELLQDTFDALGKKLTLGIIATGGSTTTIIDTTLSDDFEDNQFVGWQAFVHRDAGGSGAAPQNEVARVSAYVASSKTLTVATLTAAVAAGDEILLVKPRPLSLADAKRLCNTALREIGEIPAVDTSITLVAGTTTYTLPSTIRKRPKQVKYIPTSGTTYYAEVFDWDVIPSTPGANWTLYVPSGEVGTAVIYYDGLHPMLSTYSDSVMDAIEPQLAKAVCGWYCAQWLARDDETWRATANDLYALYQAEFVKSPPQLWPRKAKGMPHWSSGKRRLTWQEENA